MKNFVFITLLFFVFSCSEHGNELNTKGIELEIRGPNPPTPSASWDCSTSGIDIVWRSVTPACDEYVKFIISYQIYNGSGWDNCDGWEETVIKPHNYPQENWYNIGNPYNNSGYCDCGSGCYDWYGWSCSGSSLIDDYELTRIKIDIYFIAENNPGSCSPCCTAYTYDTTLYLYEGTDYGD